MLQFAQRRADDAEMDDPISDMATVALVQRSPRVGLSAAVALFIVTVETVAASFGCFALLYVDWRDEATITSSAATAAAALAGVGLVTLRTMNVLQRLMHQGRVRGRTDLLAMLVCGALHGALGAALVWLTITDPVDARSNVLVVVVAAASFATTVVLGLSGRAGRLPTDDEVMADARDVKSKVEDAASQHLATEKPLVPNRATSPV